jgi:ABC-type cobalamin/Fe3+-siderophores transport system ATPase subunit
MVPRTTEDWQTLHYEAMQLFSPSAPVDEAALFAGRQVQIQKLIDTVLERGKHAVLFGERGVGKTSLAKVFRVLFPSIVSQVRLIRQQLNADDSFSDVWKKVFKEIEFVVRADGEEKRLTAADFYEGAITSDDVVREIKAAFSSNEIPVIVFDEFDRATDEVRKQMANVVKDLSDDSVNVTVIIVGVSDDIGGLLEEHASLRRCLEQVPMPRMSNDEMKEIINKRIPRLGMKIEPNALWKIVTLSRGLPSYVHLLGVYSVQDAVGSRKLTITEAHVDAAITRALEKSQESVRSDYAAAVHTNRTDTLFREVLLACALAKTDDRGFFNPQSVVDPLASILGKSVKIANFQNHLKEFISKERGAILIRRGKERAYKFRFLDPMMQPFIIMRGVEDGLIQASGLDVLSSPEQPQFQFPNEPQKPS